VSKCRHTFFGPPGGDCPQCGAKPNKLACEHGHLARSCERCDDRREIERLRNEAEGLRKELFDTCEEAIKRGHAEWEKIDNLTLRFRWK
jgi:hypothetical protein